MYRLKELRKNNKKTLKDIANILHCAVSTYNSYELGTSQPNIDSLIILAKYYKTTIDYLVGVSTEPSNLHSEDSKLQKGYILLSQLDDLYLDMSITYMSRMLEDQTRIKKLSTFKQH